MGPGDALARGSRADTNPAARRASHELAVVPPLELDPRPDRAGYRVGVELHRADDVVADLCRADRVGRERERGVGSAGERQQRANECERGDRVTADVVEEACHVSFGLYPFGELPGPSA